MRSGHLQVLRSLITTTGSVGGASSHPCPVSAATGRLSASHCLTAQAASTPLICSFCLQPSLVQASGIPTPSPVSPGNPSTHSGPRIPQAMRLVLGIF